MINLRDKLVLVLGLGETGLSLVRWLSAQNARVRVADSRDLPPSLDAIREQFPRVELCCGAFREELLQGVELLAISPGVPLRDPFVQHAATRSIPIVGDIELFAQQLNAQSPIIAPRVLAITGSNGKTTVTRMVEHLCRAAGKDAVAAGNISPAILDAVLQRGTKQPEVWVLELSSFQLETTFSLNADAATVLNVSEDHLDRYAGMDEYAAAKARIFRGTGVQVLNRDDAYSSGMALPGHRHMTFGLNKASGDDSWGMEQSGADIWLTQDGKRLLNAAELQVAGLHNVANALAALALCRAIDLPLPPLLAALRSFKGLPHRVERVAEIDGVVYYDDSKGTNVGATVAALEGLGGMGARTSSSACGRNTRVPTEPEAGRKVVLIAGGEGKGQDFAPLYPAVAQHARAVVLIGRDAPLIKAALHGCGILIEHAADMNGAVRQAARLAQRGDAVLLSPACASFDMFRNYVHRAEVFVAAVHGLEKEGAWSH